LNGNDHADKTISVYSIESNLAALNNILTMFSSNGIYRPLIEACKSRRIISYTCFN